MQMELWAKTYSGSQQRQVQFLCVCVEPSLRVAQMFDEMFSFQYAINCYIPSRDYLPRGYGQLGCSGFIISDGKGNFVSRKTKAYLDYGEYAFRDVEAILATLLPAAPAPPTQEAAETETKKKRKLVGEGKKQDNKTDGHTMMELEEVAAATDKYLPPSVGVDSMDREHATCAQALRALTEAPTEANLRRLLDELENHFAHEETLMMQHGFGGGGDGSFSAINSHIQDHVRILELGRVELRRIKEEKESTTSTNCATGTSS